MYATVCVLFDVFLYYYLIPVFIPFILLCYSHAICLRQRIYYVQWYCYFTFYLYLLLKYDCIWIWWVFPEDDDDDCAVYLLLRVALMTVIIAGKYMW